MTPTPAGALLRWVSYRADDAAHDNPGALDLRMLSLTCICAVLIGILVVGCGPTQPASGRPTDVTPPPSRAVPNGVSPFSRRDTPPEGVAKFLTFEGGSADDEPIGGGIGSISPRRIQIGEAAQLTVSGGPPGGLASAYLYRFGVGSTGESGFSYVSDLGPIVLDTDGNGQLALTPLPGDVPGPYGLIVLPIGSTPASTIPDPEAFGTLLDYRGVATSEGLDCDDMDGETLACRGRLGSAEVEMFVFATSGGEVRELSATATTASDAAVRLFASLASRASGEADAARWVESASPAQPLQRQFGEVPIELFPEFEGGWTLFIGSSEQTNLPPPGWVGLDVRP
jgi:hypothetical protein